MKARLLSVLFFTLSIFANPTSGWDEESQGSGGGFLGIVVTIMAVVFIIMVIGILTDKEPEIHFEKDNGRKETYKTYKPKKKE